MHLIENFLGYNFDSKYFSIKKFVFQLRTKIHNDVLQTNSTYPLLLQNNWRLKIDSSQIRFPIKTQRIFHFGTSIRTGTILSRWSFCFVLAAECTLCIPTDLHRIIRSHPVNEGLRKRTWIRYFLEDCPQRLSKFYANYPQIPAYAIP